MGILVPLLNIDWIKPLIEAGAEEFYAGFHDLAWKEQFKGKWDLNRMSEFGDDANPMNFERLLEAARLISNYEKKMYVTFNSPIYPDQALSKVQEYFIQLKEAGATGVILSCDKLIPLAKKANLKVTMSTIAGIYNEDIARYYRDLKCDRLILPRDLTLKEILAIRKAVTDIELEIFILRNPCIFSDSHCLASHSHGSFCRYLRKTLGGEITYPFLKTTKTKDEKKYNNHLFAKHFFEGSACGMCGLYQFEKNGIDSYKIVGRADIPQEVLDDLKVLKENIRLARQTKSQVEYLEKMHPPVDSRIDCSNGFHCYYPEIKFGEV